MLERCVLTFENLEEKLAVRPLSGSFYPLITMKLWKLQHPTEIHIIWDNENHCTKFLTLRRSEKYRFFSYLFGKRNPFHDTAFFIYPLQTTENLWYSRAFRVYRKKRVSWNRLTFNAVLSLKDNVIAEIWWWIFMLLLSQDLQYVISFWKLLWEP